MGGRIPLGMPAMANATSGIGRRKVLVRLAAGFGVATAGATGGWLLYEGSAAEPTGREGAFLRAYASKGDLAEQLRSALELDAGADLASDGARASLMRVCRRQLADGHTIPVHGWMLAQCEVDYCAWLALEG